MKKQLIELTPKVYLHLMHTVKTYKAMIKKRHALMVLLLVISFNIIAQTNIVTEQTYYSKLVASNYVQKPIDFNLKGDVKSFYEISAQNNDSSSFCFNNQGWLVKHYISSTKELTVYIFENSQLKSILVEQPRSKSTSKKYFDSFGFIEKEVTERIDASNTIQQLNYLFNEKHDTLNIYFKYNFDPSSRDVILNTFYTFTFNNKHQVIKERNLSMHGESTYKSTKTYSYDSISGNLIYMKLVDDCALEDLNSCSNYEIFIKYDNHNNIIYKSLSDRTVRNSTWRSDYVYYAMYNQNNDIIEEYYNDLKGEKIYLPGSFIKLPNVGNSKDVVEVATLKFEYEYDLKGNWVKKFKCLNNEKKTYQK